MFCLAIRQESDFVTALTTFFCGSEAKHFHSRSVSSAAADTTVEPSGDMAMWRTREVWPVSSATLFSVGYRQMMSW